MIVFPKLAKMQNVRECLTYANQNSKITSLFRGSLFHTSSSLQRTDRSEGPQKFLSYNNTIFPPTKSEEPERPAVCNHS